MLWSGSIEKEKMEILKKKIFLESVLVLNVLSYM